MRRNGASEGPGQLGGRQIRRCTPGRAVSILAAAGLLDSSRAQCWSGKRDNLRVKG